MADLDAALSAASPAANALSNDVLAVLMNRAMKDAEAALDAGDLPVGAAIGRADGTVLATGRNRAATEHDRLQHAVTDALHTLFRTGANEPGLVLATTLEPCSMCLGAATEAGIHAVAYALEAPPNGARGKLKPLAGRALPLVHRGPGRDASLALLKRAADERGRVRPAPRGRHRGLAIES